MALPRLACCALVMSCGFGCGDNLPPDPVFAPTSGTRLRVNWYGYDDGSRQLEATQLYDAQLHARCAPAAWIDDVVRCVPLAAEAVYLDAACENLVGRGDPVEDPTHFLAYEWRGADRVPARVFVAGDETTPITTYYEKRDGACVGPLFAPGAVTYYALDGEIAGADLLAVRDGEVGDGRLGLRVREADDGLRVPYAVRDRELGVDCTPIRRADGRVTCDPTAAPPAAYFLDPACSARAVAVPDTAPAPAMASLLEPSGCARYAPVGAEVTPPLYRQSGDACVPVAPPPLERVFAVEAPIDLPTLDLTIEDTADRRLQRMIISDGALVFAADHLLDTATRGECRRITGADDVTRCLPAPVAPATTLYRAGCVVGVPVVELPERMCQPPRFATDAADGVALHAIGDLVAEPLYTFSDFTCRPYAGPPGTVLRTLGPVLDASLFMAAVYYWEP